MITGTFPIDRFEQRETPFYYYDMQVLHDTLTAVQTHVSVFPSAMVHYAVKACATPAVLRAISAAGLGADCVSGGEIELALRHGFAADRIVFAGVAKTDCEIRFALQQGIGCFNVESLPELEVLADIAAQMNKVASVCLRINPNIDAHTHAKITTGMQENKFGIPMQDIPVVVQACLSHPFIALRGLHFHIGSQITDMNVFAALSDRINDLVAEVERITPVTDINVGGGLGILYEHPNHFPIPDFKNYFATYQQHLHLREGQMVHFELGRSVVAQCGNLITRVLYVKQGVQKQFAIVDAGMTDLIRPALYGAFHRIENISRPDAPDRMYDIVGPICESSDVFATDYRIAQIQRGDLLAIRSAGAYGEVMASCYNQRRLPGNLCSE